MDYKEDKMLKKTICLTFSSEINVDTETLFAFHIDTNNLPKITPPWIDVKIISLDLPLHKESEIELDIKRFGVRQRWIMRISAMQAPNLVCDTALQSPFKSFIHYHRFESIDKTRSVIKDEISFTLPLYPFSLIAVPFIRRDMQKIFEFRHKQTKILLKKK